MRDREERKARMEVLEENRGWRIRRKGENLEERAREAGVEQARGTMGWPKRGLRRTEVGSLEGLEAVCGLSCLVANERQRNTSRTKMQSNKRIKTGHWRFSGGLRVLPGRTIEMKKRNTKRRKRGRIQDSLLCRILPTSAIDKKSSM